MNKQFSVFLSISTLLHCITCILILSSKTIFLPRTLPKEETVFMHLVTISDINNIKTRSQKKSNLPSIDNAKKVDLQNFPNLPPQSSLEQQTLPVSTPPQDLHKEISQSEVSVKDSSDNHMNLKKTESSKSNPPAEPNPPEKKLRTKSLPLEHLPNTQKPIPSSPALKTKEQAMEKKPITKTNVKNVDLDKLEKLLAQKAENNKEKASEGSKTKSSKKSGSTNKNKQDSMSTKYHSDLQESAKAETSVKQKIENNWNKPPSMRDYNNLTVKVKLTLDFNQEVQAISNFEFLNELVPNNTKLAVQDSIIRAIRLSAPFDTLDIEHYEHWREIVLNFICN